MTIYVGSRYEEDPIDRVQSREGDFIPTIYPTIKPALQAFNFGVYLTSQGDRLDQLAGEYLGDPELSWVIANANPELLYPDDIPHGTLLRIPDRYVR